MLKIDGFDEALIGIATVWQKADEGGVNRVDTLVYNGNTLIALLHDGAFEDYRDAERKQKENSELYEVQLVPFYPSPPLEP